MPLPARHLLDRLPVGTWARFAASLFAVAGLVAGGRLAGPRGGFVGVVAGAVLGCLIGPVARGWRSFRGRPAVPAKPEPAGAVGAAAGAVVGAAAGAAAGPAGLVAGASVGSVAGDRLARGAAHHDGAIAEHQQAKDDVRAGVGSAGGAVIGAVIGSVAGPLGAAAGTRIGAAAGEVAGRHDNAGHEDQAAGTDSAPPR